MIALTFGRPSALVAQLLHLLFFLLQPSADRKTNRQQEDGNADEEEEERPRHNPLGIRLL